MNLEGSDISGAWNASTGDHKEAKKPLSFISKERDHKFDLLLHLIANLRQPLLVCGPAGIGKTRVLKQIEEVRSSHWAICHLTLSRSLSIAALFETIVKDQGWTEKANRSNSPDEILSQKLGQLSGQKKILVLLLDNSGELAPGVLTELAKFSETHQALRLVVAMTLDQLQIKESTDPAVNDFHVVEIPTLTEQQCGDYMRNLSAGPDGILSLKAINPILVQTVYQETDGIPGRIKETLPVIGASGAGFVIKRQAAKYKPFVWTMFFLLVSALGVVTWTWLKPVTDEVDGSGNGSVSNLSGKEQRDSAVTITEPVFQSTPLPVPLINDREGSSSGKAESQAAENGAKKSGINEISEQLAGSEADAPLSGITSEPETAMNAAESFDRSDLTGEEASIVTPLTDPAPQKTVGDSESAVLQPLPEVEELPPVPDLEVSSSPVGESTLEAVTELQAAGADEILPNNPAEAKAGGKWLAGQSTSNYTIQLIALSSEQGTIKLMKQFPQLQPAAYFRSPRRNGDLFPLFYGSFETLEAAVAAQNQLPKKFGKGWMRRFSSVHQEMKRAEN